MGRIGLRNAVFLLGCVTGTVGWVENLDPCLSLTDHAPCHFGNYFVLTG